jgi:hypothetical protein
MVVSRAATVTERLTITVRTKSHPLSTRPVGNLANLGRLCPELRSCRCEKVCGSCREPAEMTLGSHAAPRAEDLPV